MTHSSCEQDEAAFPGARVVEDSIEEDDQYSMTLDVTKMDVTTQYVGTGFVALETRRL